MRSFLLSFLITSNLTTIQAQDKKAKEPLVHTVLFWLKSPESKPDCIAFETAIQKLIANNPQKNNWLFRETSQHRSSWCSRC